MQGQKFAIQAANEVSIVSLSLEESVQNIRALCFLFHTEQIT